MLNQTIHFWSYPRNKLRHQNKFGRSLLLDALSTVLKSLRPISHCRAASALHTVYTMHLNQVLWCPESMFDDRMPETTLVSLRTLHFFSPLVTNTSSSFNATKSLSTLDHCSCFDFLTSGVKISQPKFLIYASLHHRLHDSWKSKSSDEWPCRTIATQFFELIRLTYSQFVQTFQDIIRWDLGHR